MNRWKIKRLTLFPNFGNSRQPPLHVTTFSHLYSTEEVVQAVKLDCRIVHSEFSGRHSCVKEAGGGVGLELVSSS